MLGKIDEIIDNSVIVNLEIDITEQPNMVNLHVVFEDGNNKVVGEIVQNPNNPSQWGIKNLSNDNWTYIKPDGQHIPIAIGKSAGIAKGIKIDFGQSVGEIN